jgi:hypothetical protein
MLSPLRELAKRRLRLQRMARRQKHALHRKVQRAAIESLEDRQLLTVTVFGTSDPWLAGMPDGSTASAGSAAPAYSPAQADIAVVGGQSYTFAATGSVAHGPNLFSGPDGRTGVLYSHLGGAENGIGGITVQINALLGVFLDDSRPNTTGAPPALNFSSPASMEFQRLSPALKQPFFIGNGLTSSGVTQEFVAPAGATRLFLGAMDAYGYSNNLGSYSVTSSQVILNTPPVISDQSFRLDENSANGTVVGTAVASDADLPGDTLSWSITGGNTGGAFAIDSANGQITVANMAALDFEATPSFNLTVQVTDSYREADSATVTVDLNDLLSTLSISDASVTEGGNLAFTVLLSDAVADDTIVSYSTGDGSADGSDYTAATSTITIPAGETRGTITVATADDNTVELDETMSVNITGVAGSNDVSMPSGMNFVEDFSTYAVGSLNGQNGWHTGIAPGLLYVGNGFLSRSSTFGVFSFASSVNENLFSLPAGSPEVTLEIVMRGKTNDGFKGVTSLVNSSGASLLSFGHDGGGFRLTRGNGTTYFVGNIPGDDAIQAASHRFFSHRLTYNFETHTGRWDTRRLDGDANYTTIKAFTAADVGLAIDNPANWTGLSLGATGSSDLFGGISVTVPGSTAITGTGTILNDDIATVLIGDASVSEGGVLNFKVALSNPVDVDTVISYSTADGSATTAGNDYIAASGSIRILAGETTGTITVATTDDIINELTETLSVNLTAVEAGGRSVVIGDGTGDGTITNEDGSYLTLSNASATEGGDLVFDVSLSNPVDVDTVVTWSTVDGTATTAADDYIGQTAQTLTIPAGQLSGTITISTTADRTVELDETMSIAVTRISASGRPVKLGASKLGNGAGTIVNDDNATISIDDVTASETDGDTTFTFTISLTNAVDVDGTLTVAASNGSAVAGSDYQKLSGTVVVPAGATSATVNVTVTGDDVVERDETFFVTLSLSDGSQTEEPPVKEPRPEEPPVEEPLAEKRPFEEPLAEEPPPEERELTTEEQQQQEAASSGEKTVASAPTKEAAVAQKSTSGSTSFGGRAITIADGDAVGTIINDDFAPVTNAGGAYIINEGDGLSLNASASTDADSGFAALTFRWDVDGDGDYDENVTGATPTLTAVQMAALGLNDGPDSRTVTVEASDGTNIGSATTTLTINNVAPSVVANVQNVSTIELVQNGEFENPTISGDWAGTRVPFWNNSVDGGSVEIWSSRVAGSWSPRFGSDGQPIGQQLESSFNSLGVITQTIDFSAIPAGASIESLQLSFDAWTRSSGTATYDLYDVTAGTSLIGGPRSVSSSTSAWIANVSPLVVSGIDPSHTVQVVLKPTSGDAGVNVHFDQVSLVAEVGSGATVEEGETATADGSFSDQGQDIVTITASVGSIVQSTGNSGTWQWSFDTTDGPVESQTVVVTATDSDGAASQTTFDLVVTNVAPDFEAGTNETLLPPVAGAFSRSLSFTDPGADFWSGTVNFGDGSGNQDLRVDQASKWFDLNHVYAADGTYSVSVTVRDDDGGSLTDSFAVTVFLNTPPEANDDNVSTDEDNAVTFNVLDNDTDEQNNIDARATVALTEPSRGTLIDNGSGSFTFNASGAFESLAVGESAQVSFDYQIEDTFGETDTARATITVNGVNDVPEISSALDSVSVSEGKTASNKGLWSDIDASDRVTLRASIGTVTQNADGTWSWDLQTTDGPDDSQTVVITADDGNRGVSTTSFELTVKNVAPTANADHDTLFEDGAFTLLTLLDNDTDPAGGNDPLTITGVDFSGTKGAVKFVDGQVSYSPNGQFEWLPAGVETTDSFTYTLSDGDGGTSTGVVTITIVGENDAPTVASTVANVEVKQNAENTVIDVSRVFTDVDQDDVVRVSAVSSDDRVVTASVDGNLLTLDYQPKQSGTVTITLTGWDSAGTSARTTFEVVVLSPARQVERVAEKIYDLVEGDETEETIVEGQANALTTSLFAALKQIGRDTENSIKTAVKQIEAFENKVNAYMKSRQITSDEGKQLLRAADELKKSLLV